MKARGISDGSTVQVRRELRDRGNVRTRGAKRRRNKLWVRRSLQGQLEQEDAPETEIDNPSDSEVRPRQSEQAV